MHQSADEPACVTSTCPACWTPMPMDDDARMLAHPGRHGTPCDGAGRPAVAVPTHA